MSKRTIAIFTGNRAEYGLQLPILRAVDAHPDLEYKLLVSGAHLDQKFGRTLKEIQRDGFEVHAEIKIQMDKETPEQIQKFRRSQYSFTHESFHHIV